MAIYPKLGAYVGSNAPNLASTQPIDITAWTVQATESLQAVSLSSPAVTLGPSMPLAIPLDDTAVPGRNRVEDSTEYATDGITGYRSRREPLRRDSLKRREALLKGKEGSRRRHRWENDRLLSNPWAQPPLPSDWEVHPTYPKHVVPYYLAPLWDGDLAARSAAVQKKRGDLAKRSQSDDGKHSKVPKELRERFKKAKAAKGLLRDLEEEVRKFVAKWEEKERTRKKDGLYDIDSDEEEIVFVGRNGQMHDMPQSPRSKRVKEEEDIKRDKLVFDSLADDHGASFGWAVHLPGASFLLTDDRRWLVHSIATYYGLRTWSKTVGDPARREAYVGVKQGGAGGTSKTPVAGLPRPLWCMV